MLNLINICYFSEVTLDWRNHEEPLYPNVHSSKDIANEEVKFLNCFKSDLFLAQVICKPLCIKHKSNLANEFKGEKE
jgi:hypothetical protein